MPVFSSNTSEIETFEELGLFALELLQKQIKEGQTPVDKPYIKFNLNFTYKIDNEGKYSIFSSPKIKGALIEHFKKATKRSIIKINGLGTEKPNVQFETTDEETRKIFAELIKTKQAIDFINSPGCFNCSSNIDLLITDTSQKNGKFVFCVSPMVLNADDSSGFYQITAGIDLFENKINNFYTHNKVQINGITLNIACGKNPEIEVINNDKITFSKENKLIETLIDSYKKQLPKKSVNEPAIEPIPIITKLQRKEIELIIEKLDYLSKKLRRYENYSLKELTNDINFPILLNNIKKLYLETPYLKNKLDETTNYFVYLEKSEKFIELINQVKENIDSTLKLITINYKELPTFHDSRKYISCFCPNFCHFNIYNSGQEEIFYIKIKENDVATRIYGESIEHRMKWFETAFIQDLKSKNSITDLGKLNVLTEEFNFIKNKINHYLKEIPDDIDFYYYYLFNKAIISNSIHENTFPAIEDILNSCIKDLKSLSVAAQEKEFLQKEEHKTIDVASAGVETKAHNKKSIILQYSKKNDNFTLAGQQFDLKPFLIQFIKDVYKINHKIKSSKDLGSIAHKNAQKWRSYKTLVNNATKKLVKLNLLDGSFQFCVTIRGFEDLPKDLIN